MRTHAFLVLVSCALHVAAADYKVFFGNLHSHTSYSDGSGTPSDAYKYAKSRVDFLAITEHNHKGAEKGIKAGDPRKDGILIANDHSLYKSTATKSLLSAAKRYTKDGEFVALFGQEFSTIQKGGNHVNVFEVAEVIDETVVTNGGFGQLINWLVTHSDSEQKPAIIQFNHPEKEIREAGIEYGRDDFLTIQDWIQKMSKHACLIEVFNGPGTVTPAPNLKHDVFTSDYFYYLNVGFKLAPTGNQDNHHRNWGDSTPVRTGVIAETLTKPRILDAMRKRHVYATTDPNLQLVFWVNKHLCGDVITTNPAASSELNIEYVINDADEPDADYDIEVYSDDRIGGAEAKLVEKVSVSGNTPFPTPKKIQDVPFTGNGQYVFFIVRQKDEHAPTAVAVTAPVWIEAGAIQPGVALPALGGVDESKLVASKNSDLFHVSLECSAAKAIKVSNRITGAAARNGRRLHPNCPVKRNT